MIGTLWKANFDYLSFNKGDVLIITKYFHCQTVDAMFVALTSPQGSTSTWREEWMGNKFERLEE